MKEVAVRKRAGMFINRQKSHTKGKELSLVAVFWSVMAIIALVGVTIIGTVDVVGIAKETTKGQALLFFSVLGCFALTYARYWWNKNVK